MHTIHRHEQRGKGCPTDSRGLLTPTAKHVTVPAHPRYGRLGSRELDKACIKTAHSPWNCASLFLAKSRQARAEISQLARSVPDADLNHAAGSSSNNTDEERTHDAADSPKSRRDCFRSNDRPRECSSVSIISGRGHVALLPRELHHACAPSSNIATVYQCQEPGLISLAAAGASSVLRVWRVSHA